MEKPNSKNSSDELPSGNYAGRRRRLQQDCTVKLFPPISPSTESPSNQGDPAKIATSTAAGRKSHGNCEGGHHTCCCCCRHKKKHQRSRCNSRMIDSAFSSCSSSSSCSSRSTASSWSSCSSRSSAASSISDCSSLLERESSTLRALSRSREVKDVLKRIAEELASNDDTGGIGRNKGKGVLGDSRGDPHAPPPSRILTGAHYLDWYIPRHIAGSRALGRSKSAKSAAAKRTEIASPMHKPEKQAWVTQIIDPKTTSLPLPTPPKPPVLQHPCPRADNLWEALSKDQINSNPYTYASHLANSNYLSNSFPPPRYSAIRPSQSALASKSLLLPPPPPGKEGCFRGATVVYPHPGAAEPLSGPVFTQSQVPNKTWFIVHPDWRLEPRPGEDV